MNWLGRVGDLLSPSDEVSEGAIDEPVPGPVERGTPGVSALLGAVDQDAGHAVLDLGPATGSSLRVYERFARRVRFADLIAARSERGLAAALDAVPPQRERPYDLLFAWNALDRLPPRERPLLVRRLAEIGAPDARLHVVVDASEEATTRVPTGFSLLDVDRMRYDLGVAEGRVWDPLLAADLEELLAPFRVVRGFTLESGLREYVAVREDRTGRAGAEPG